MPWTGPTVQMLDNAYELLNRAQIPFLTKESLFRLLRSDAEAVTKLPNIHSTCMDEGTRAAVTELLTAW